MATTIVSAMLSRGEAAEWIQRLYQKVKNKPFTYKEIIKKVPHFRVPLLTAMHNSKVIRLLNGKKRATGVSKKNPSVWVFTAEALFVLEKHNSK
jgi:hypothetical protein